MIEIVGWDGSLKLYDNFLKTYSFGSAFIDSTPVCTSSVPRSPVTLCWYSRKKCRNLAMSALK